MNSGIILTVGNSLMGDDGAGPMLAGLLAERPAPGWQVVDGGSAPENAAHEIAAVAPARVLVVDAADMGLAPGEMRLIDETTIVEMFIVTTHDLPLSFLIERLRESAGEVLFLGIQPDLVAFGFPMSEPVRQAVIALHEQLVEGGDPATFESL
jgi:hydrogenase 3 maturation protease